MLVVPGHTIKVLTILVFQDEVLPVLSHFHHGSEGNRCRSDVYMAYLITVSHKETIQADAHGGSGNKFQFILPAFLQW